MNYWFEIEDTNFQLPENVKLGYTFKAKVTLTVTALEQHLSADGTEQRTTVRIAFNEVT